MSEAAAAVCGNEVRLYGPADEKGRRAYRGMVIARHHGDALCIAADYEARSAPTPAPKKRKPRTVELSPESLEAATAD